MPALGQNIPDALHPSVQVTLTGSIFADFGLAKSRSRERYPQQSVYRDGRAHASIAAKSLSMSEDRWLALLVHCPSTQSRVVRALGELPRCIRYLKIELERFQDELACTRTKNEAPIFSTTSRMPEKP